MNHIIRELIAGLVAIAMLVLLYNDGLKRSQPIALNIFVVGVAAIWLLLR